MKIYLDLLFILNFAFDFLLLLSTSVLLRRNANIHHLLIGAFIGGLSILSLFIPMSSVLLFFIKILISIIMILISFGYRDLKYTFRNLGYFYMTSIVLGGFLYFLNVQFSYKQEGIVFYHNGLSINYIVLLILSPIILYFYIKQGLFLKNNYSHYYKIKIHFDEKQVLTLSAFLDTGNTLCDPYFHRPVIIINKKKMIYDINQFGMFLVPYKTVSGESLLPCVKASYLEIDKVGRRENFLVGFMEESILIDGIDCILNEKIMEG
ncbi:MAG: sigma-E processing peptidase SpoIIGA [Bacilli bacterium]|nr:sigma-E processing peptidase SpoIIGA [Bacilli bacterium]